MKAVVVTRYGGPEVLEYKQMEVPAPGPRQVLIRVKAAGVNFADIKARYGKYHGAGEPPFIPGLDVAGIVEAAGAEVKNFRQGDRVIAFPETGSYAEYTVADAALTYKLPEGIDFETAAACPVVSLTSYKLLADVARIVEGETVLIHAAAGGVGTTAVQLAKILGARMVIGTVGSDAKKAVAQEAGADHVINYEKEDFVSRVRALTDGRGADVILDSLAGEVAEKSLECLATYGRLVNFGIASGVPGRILTTDLHASCRSVLGFSLGTTRKQRPHLLAEAAEKVLSYLAEGRLRMFIGQRFALAEAAAAHRLVENRLSTGKVLLLT
ncbi:quinone oxidoreductase [Bacillaceae bacterium]